MDYRYSPDDYQASDEVGLLRVLTPFDSGDHPAFVLEDIRNDAYCGQCGKPAVEWPNEVRGWIGGNYRPAVVFCADLYCATCQPHSFDDFSGERVLTVTGEVDHDTPE